MEENKILEEEVKKEEPKKAEPKKSEKKRSRKDFLERKLHCINQMEDRGKAREIYSRLIRIK